MGLVQFIDYKLVPIQLWVPHGVFRVDGYKMDYVMGGMVTRSQPGF
jgi:hypothetical protein